MGRDKFFPHDAGHSMDELLCKKIFHLAILIGKEGVDSEKHRRLVSVTRAGIEVLQRKKEKLRLSKSLQGTSKIKTIFEKAEVPSYKSALSMRKIMDELREMGEPFDGHINGIMGDISDHIDVLMLLDLDNAPNIYGKVLEKTKSMFFDLESLINVRTQEQMETKETK